MTTPLLTEPEYALDAALGDANESARRRVELDAGEEFPADLCARLDEFGLAAQYVPVEFGGALDDHERLLRLWRTVARRDVSAVVAHGKTYLGAASVWLAGDDEQARRVASAVTSGVPVAWGLSEPEHGADLLNNSLTATERADGWRLSGVKWPINNATRAGLLTVLARTGAAGAPRGHSLFLVDKTMLPPGSWRELPKVSTLGVRGIDISGIEFHDTTLPPSALLGQLGSGLETVLRALQLTRTMCASLSLGAGEHALRIAARFVSERIIRDRPLIERAYPASILSRCAGLLAAAECAALVGVRSIHSLTGELSVSSAVVKSFAPTVVDGIIGELTELLGVRSYLTDVYAAGAFQKLARDHEIVSIFDGSTPVNRGALAQQFPRLSRGITAGWVDADGLAGSVALGQRPRPLDHSALTLLSRRGCSVVQSLPTLAETITDAPDGVVEHTRAFCRAAVRLAGRMAQVRPAARPSMAAYELAAAYEVCYAAAACLHLWRLGESDSPLWRDGGWLCAALHALRERLASLMREPAPEPLSDNGRFGRRVAEAAVAGEPVTPFGTALPTGTWS
jgi:alkylation response protein AidB-like acyl-CoA dehydrogenase